ncbi:formate dehydrogenase accessory sulfurtransferase FdhD [Oceanicola sp. 22II-s10i]|uniref:formate dehydrogenase accessory sulfurtransferase FdhD n=1 Tax=Oceanicola sp. 22II-s10i TaxID=1317116 RepID=UPI000B528525|nr:formate dehydrogenase accessory sulfurtransferase FdhD [Oceanicola sp. 22II-s10i]
MKGVASRPVWSVRGDARRAGARALPEEVPVAVVVNGTSLAVMMASPADLEDFAVGFCLTEGIVGGVAEIESVEIAEHPQGIEARLWIEGARAGALMARRRAMAGPVGCGLCGIDSLAEAARDVPRVGTGPLFDVAGIAGATEALRAFQPLHDRARAVHAAGFMMPDGVIVAAREDVGRHNALDKLIGGMAREGAAMTGGAVVLTSRISVEMVQKCAVAGVPAVVAVSAPTTLALEVAERAGITLVTAAGTGGFDLWTHAERIGGDVDVA